MVSRWSTEKVLKTNTKQKRTTMENTNAHPVSDIDAAINAAKARKAERDANPDAEPTTPSVSLPTDSVETTKRGRGRPPLSDEERAARAKLTAEQKIIIAQQRLAARMAKLPKASKVDIAAGRLPVLSESATQMFNELKASFTSTELLALSAHIVHFNRANATQRAATIKVPVGATVKVIAGDPRFVGLVGTVVRSQRIRVYVKVEGQAKELYLYSSDVAVQDAEELPVEDQPETDVSVAV